MKKCCVIISVVCMIFLSACTGWGTEAADRSQSTDLGQDEYTADAMSITPEKDKEFIVMRVNDDYREISRNCDWVYLESGGEYPPLENGQVARVKADVAIYGGGIRGYTGNIFIRKLKKYEVLEYKEVLKILEIPDCENRSTSGGEKLLKYQTLDRCYFVVINRQYIEVYQDGVFVKEYDYTDLDATNTLAPFWAEVEEKAERDKQEHQDQMVSSQTEPVVAYGDRVHLLSYRRPIGGEWKASSKEIFSVDVEAEQFQHGDYEMSQEELYLNVEEALGHKVGDSFTVSFEYGDCRVFHRYTILEIEKNSELGNQKDVVEYGDTVKASHKEAERLAEYAIETEYMGGVLLDVKEETTSFTGTEEVYPEEVVKDVVKKVQGKSRSAGELTSCDEQYEYIFRVNSVNEYYEPSYQLPDHWEYSFAAPKIGSFKGYKDEEAEPVDKETGDVFGYDDRLTKGCSAWCGMEEFICQAEASSALPTMAGIQYQASNLTEGSRFSVWSEGAKGPGIGEYIDIKQMYMGSGDPEFTFSSICIVNGYAENEEKWQENGRVKSFKLYYEDEYMGLIELEDTMLPQYIDVTPVQMKVGNGFEADFRFEIAEVYKGTKYEDTCITGIVIDFEGKYAH